MLVIALFDTGDGVGSDEEPERTARGLILLGCLHSVGILISGFYIQFARWVGVYRAPATKKSDLTNQGMLP